MFHEAIHSGGLSHKAFPQSIGTTTSPAKDVTVNAEI
jgi:hypothetical protein